MSSGFFEPIIQDVLKLVNEEFRKLRLGKISRDDIFLFFEEATAGIAIEMKLSKSKKKILNQRLVKIAFEISERHCINGFKIIVSLQ